MSAPSGQVRSSKQWFDGRLTWVLILGLIICGAVIYFIESAKRGTKLFLRRIAGLEAIDEAVGRATEMGRPILFVAGIQDMDDVQTIAGLTILGSIARTVAQYDSKINMPVRASLVMTAARETIKLHMTASRPDACDDMVHYVTDEQFDLPPPSMASWYQTCRFFFLGAFSRVSDHGRDRQLSWSNSGSRYHHAAQVPFFVAACDYLIGGTFRGVAYLSGEPPIGIAEGADVGESHRDDRHSGRRHRHYGTSAGFE
jgi:hypothetical protein